MFKRIRTHGTVHVDVLKSDYNSDPTGTFNLVCITVFGGGGTSETTELCEESETEVLDPWFYYVSGEMSVNYNYSATLIRFTFGPGTANRTERKYTAIE